MKRVCYVAGNELNYHHPAHARRFPRYAKRVGLDFFDYDSNGCIEGDITIVTQAGDLSFWKRKKLRGKKLVFDANDPYLLPAQNNLKSQLRGLAKFIGGKHRYLDVNYRELYKEICLKSDAVVVSHFAQRQLLESWGVPTFEIKDYPATDVSHHGPKDPLSCDTVNIFWEGLGSSFLPFGLIEDIFSDLEDADSYRFHFVTDLSFYRYMDKFVPTDMVSMGRKSAPRMSKYFNYYQWTPENFSAVARRCDFAIVPLPMDFSMNYWKPENKVIQLWRAGLPVIASAIPSYQKVYEAAGLETFCRNREEWIDKLYIYARDPERRKVDSMKASRFVSNNYSSDRIDSQWRQLLDFIG